MPTYEHKCQDDTCNHEWEDFYSITAEPPTTCPKCGKETAKRLLSLSASGRVTLYGDDLVAQVKADTQKLKKDIYSSEKLYSNVLGESKYQDLQTGIDKNKK